MGGHVDPAHPGEQESSAARELGEAVDVLWPEVFRRTVKTGADREIVAVYTRRSEMPRTLFRDLVGTATRRLLFGGYTSYFVWLDIPQAAETLAAKVGEGADVRFLLGDPASPVTAQREAIEATPLTVSTRIAITQAELAKIPNARARFTDRHIALSFWIFDDDAVIATHIGDSLGQDSVTFHMRRRQPGGPVDRYTEHFESLWASSRE